MIHTKAAIRTDESSTCGETKKRKMIAKETKFSNELDFDPLMTEMPETPDFDMMFFQPNFMDAEPPSILPEEQCGAKVEDTTPRENKAQKRRRKENTYESRPQFMEEGEWRLLKNEILKDLHTGEFVVQKCGMKFNMWWSSSLIIDIFELKAQPDSCSEATSFEAYTNLIHKDDRELARHYFQRAILKGQPFEMTKRFVLLSGRVKWARVKCRVQKDENGNTILIAGIVQDITRWYNAFETQADQHQKVAKSFAKSPRKTEKLVPHYIPRDEMPNIEAIEDATCVVC